MSGVITIRKIKKSKTRSGGSANAKASRARRGDFNVLWLIVAIIGVVIGVVIFYFVYAGTMGSMKGTTAPIITAQTASGLLTVNIKVSGVGSVDIDSINLYSGTNQVTTGCSASDYYLNGQSAGAPPVTIKPGDTYTVVYSGSACSSVTTVQVITSAGTYTATVT
mgnify:FL=1